MEKLKKEKFSQFFSSTCKRNKNLMQKRLIFHLRMLSSEIASKILISINTLFPIASNSGQYRMNFTKSIHLYYNIIQYNN